MLTSLIIHLWIIHMYYTPHGSRGDNLQYSCIGRIYYDLHVGVVNSSWSPDASIVQRGGVPTQLCIISKNMQSLTSDISGQQRWYQ